MNDQADNIKLSLIRSYTSEANARDLKALPEWKEIERQRFLDRLRYEDKRDFLEIGAGTGRDSLFFKQNGLSVTCIDITPSMIQLCLEKGLIAYKMDVSKMSFKPDSFDAVFCMNSLVHMPKSELKSALEEIYRILKPGGLYLNCMWGGIDSEGVSELDDHDPKRFFSFSTDENAKQAFGNIFIIEEIRAIDVGRNVHPQIMHLRKINS